MSQLPADDTAEQLSALEAELRAEENKIGASVWRLGPGGKLLSSVVEKYAGESAAHDTQAIYFYADLEGSSELKHDEGTMQKVFQALQAQGLTEGQIIGATNAMQNAGIYFRETTF